MAGVKTDNRSLAVKVKLRRWLLDKAAFGELSVWDTCAGDGHIWKAMRNYYIVKRYVPCDRQPRLPGTIKGEINDLSFLGAFNTSQFNVIDIDPYGSPWEAWTFLAQRITRPTAVFLTFGLVGPIGGVAKNGVQVTCSSGAGITKFALDAIGIPMDWEIPVSPALAKFAASYCLQKSCETLHCITCGQMTLEAVTYYALLVEPKPAPVPTAEPEPPVVPVEGSRRNGRARKGGT